MQKKHTAARKVPSRLSPGPVLLHPSVQPSFETALREGVFLVIPAFNEEKVVGDVIAGLHANGWTNIIVVDDCSSDRTSSVVQAHGATVLRHVINRGQGAALKTGIDYALRGGARIIVTFDADGQLDAKDVARVIRPIVDGKADVALGSRFLGKAHNMPSLKRVMLRVAILFTWVFSGVLLSDAHNGFRALSRKAASRIGIRQDRMEHASEIIDEIAKKRLRYVEVPVTVHYTQYSIEHGQDPSNSIRVALRLIMRKLLT